MTAVLPLALLALLAAAGPSVAGPQADKRGGAVSARAVAPGPIKKFHVTAREGKISPSTLRVRKGETVRITFVSKDANYGIKFPDFDVKKKLTPEKAVVVQLTPKEKGSFEFRCSKTWSVKHWVKNGVLVVE
jgi:cytochrome c oxidase subunit 2